MTRLTSAQTEFIKSVLSLKPLVAAFDCDGTLWSGDAGEGFFSWELDLEEGQSLVPEPIARWARQAAAAARGSGAKRSLAMGASLADWLRR